MKNIVIIGVALTILGIGAYDVLKLKTKTKVLDEIIRLICFIKGELHYRTSDFETLTKSAQKQGYKYIEFENTDIFLKEYIDSSTKKEFLAFVNRIGTTDAEGQLALCDEYINRFTETLVELRQNEKSKIQVNTALSILSALCVIILFV